MEKRLSITDLRKYKGYKKERDAYISLLNDMYKPYKSPKIDVVDSGKSNVRNATDPTVSAFHLIEDERVKYEKRISKLDETVKRIDRQIYNIDDSEIKSIIIYKFQKEDEHSWKEITQIVCNQPCCENSAKIKFTRWAKKNLEN